MMKLNKIITIVALSVFIINIIIPSIVLAKENTIEDSMEDNVKIENETEEENNLKADTDNTDVKQEENNVEEIKTENSKEIVEKEDDLKDNIKSKEINLEEKNVLEKKEEIKINEKNQNQEKTDIEDNTEKTDSVELKSKVEYSSHIQSVGWEEEFSKADGETSGTEGKNKRIEAIKVRLGSSEEILENSKIKYKVHVQDYGWMDWKQDGEIAGTEGQSKRIEAIRIKLENLEGYSVVYRTYVESMGWTDWANNGEVAGTEGKGLKVEALQIKIVENPKLSINYVYDKAKNRVTATITSSKKIKSTVDDNEWKISDDQLSCSKKFDVNDKYTVKIKDIDSVEKSLEFEINQIIEPTSIVKYSSHVSGYGWEKKYSKIDGAISGLEKKDKGIEAIQVSLGNSEVIPKGAKISYQSYVTGLGWQPWVDDGTISGTTGQSRSIESVKIKISGMEGYIVEYRVLVEGLGWQKWKTNGQEAGTTGQSLEIQAIQIQVKKKEEATVEPTLEYQTHVENIGWQNSVTENEIAGTTGRALRIEALNINLKGAGEQGNIKYQTHVQDIGWQNWVNNGNIAGTTGRAKRVEAIKIQLENLNDYSVEYRVHISNYGWQKWRKNGEEAGTTGQAQKIEAIQIRIVYKGAETNETELSYRTHVQDIGWQNYTAEGFIAGTERQAKRIEAMQIQLLEANSNQKVLYRTHVQDIGWQNWKSNGSLAGTTGQAKRIEAIQIKLQGMDEYTVEYKVHIQDYGWSSWMIDGETAGTVGRAKRIEAIQIRIVPKYYRQYSGIDISSYNGDINWQAVKNSGVQFAMIRCGYRGYRSGKIVADSNFENNINNAIAAGVKVGLYFFSQAITPAEGIEEANYAISIAKKYNVTYPIAIDSEMSGADNDDGRADGLNAFIRTNAVIAFCDQVRNKGYVPMVYASRNWFYNNLQVDRLSNYEIWLAHYTGSPNLRSNYRYSYTMWQYTSSGSVYGIDGNVDMNVGYKKY